MRITEIVDTVFRDTKFPSIYKSPSVPDNDDDTDVNAYKPPSNSGFFGVVKPTPRNPHEVYKTTKRSFDGDDPDSDYYDGYYAWVTTIAPYAKSNPYLPRVRVIDKKTDLNNQIKPRYQLEKLVNYTEVSYKTLHALYLKEVPGATDELFTELRTRKYHQHNKKLIWLDIIYGVINTADEHSGTNPQADELVHLMDVASNNAEPDLENPDNAMIRLTSVGPQIVFVDPISYIG